MRKNFYKIRVLWGGIVATAVAVLAIAVCAPQSFAEDIVFSLNTGVAGQKVFLTGDLWKWDSTAVSMNEVTPGNYSASIPQPWLHQLQYKFVIDHGTRTQWLLDPNNTKTIVGNRGSCNSLLEIAFQEDPLLVADQSTPSWFQSQLKVIDPDGDERTLEILYPEYRDSNRRLVTVYFQDGPEYLNHGSVKNIIANLSKDPKFPQIIAVLIAPKNRAAEYKLSTTYSKFVAETVVPAVEQRFQIQNDPKNRLIMGASLGGLESIFTALQYPHIFENAASQSASFWFNDDVPHKKSIFSFLNEYAQNHPTQKQLKLYFDIGLFETPTMISSNERASALAMQHGIPVAFFKNPSHHDWIAWRNTTSRILLTFFGQ